MGRPSKPYPHRGHYQSIVNGVRVKLCREEEGMATALLRLAEVKAGLYPTAPAGATSKEGAEPRPRRTSHTKRLPVPRRGPVVTVADAVAAGLDWARAYYRDQPGRPSKEYHSVRVALSRVFALHHTKPIAAFGRPELREVQNEMIRAGYARTTISSNVRRMQCVWARLAQEDLIPDALASAVRLLPRLKKGRSEAAEQPRVRSEGRRHVLAAIAAAPWRSMLLLQLLTGMRPGEVSTLGPRHLREREGGHGLLIDFGEDHASTTERYYAPVENAATAAVADRIG